MGFLSMEEEQARRSCCSLADMNGPTGSPEPGSGAWSNSNSGKCRSGAPAPGRILLWQKGRALKRTVGARRIDDCSREPVKKKAWSARERSMAIHLRRSSCTELKAWPASARHAESQSWRKQVAKSSSEKCSLHQICLGAREDLEQQCLV